MIGADIWSGIWLLVDQYPWTVAIVIFLVLSIIGTVVGCSLMALTRPEDDQVRYQTKPAALDKPTHRVHIQPAADNIPWTRRVQPPGPERRT
jgi:membrane protein implicated in regulation of membrane protease activity